MDIQRADIAFFTTGGLESADCEGVNHKKVLPYLSVVQVLEGGYDIAVGNQSGQSVRGGGFFIAPAGMRQDITHHTDPVSGVMRARWLFLDAVCNGNLRFDSCYEFPTVLPGEYEEELNGVFEPLFSAGGLFEQYACCYAVMGILVRAGTPVLRSGNDSMLRAFEYIRKNYKGEIRVRDMAAHCHMSESSFYAAFKRQFGLPPVSYINKFRISLAEELLRNTDASIGEIAALVGVSDPLYFNRLFHKSYHLSPREYRSKYR